MRDVGEVNDVDPGGSRGQCALRRNCTLTPVFQSMISALRPVIVFERLVPFALC